MSSLISNVVKSAAVIAVGRYLWQRWQDSLANVASRSQSRMDDTLEDSFPASDPPAWTSTIVALRS